jgi:hypothetical protein
MPTPPLSYLNNLCCPQNACNSLSATKNIVSLANAILVKAFESNAVCSTATNNVMSIGNVSQGYLYSNSLSGGPVELISIGNVSLGFGY